MDSLPFQKKPSPESFPIHTGGNRNCGAARLCDYSIPDTASPLVSLAKYDDNDKRNGSIIASSFDLLVLKISAGRAPEFIEIIQKKFFCENKIKKFAASINDDDWSN